MTIYKQNFKVDYPLHFSNSSCHIHETVGTKPRLSGRDDFLLFEIVKGRYYVFPFFKNNVLLDKKWFLVF